MDLCVKIEKRWFFTDSCVKHDEKKAKKKSIESNPQINPVYPISPSLFL